MNSGRAQQAHGDGCRRRLFAELDKFDMRRIDKCRERMKDSSEQKFAGTEEADTEEILEELEQEKSE